MFGSNLQKLITFASRVELKPKAGEEQVILQEYVFSPFIHIMKIPASNIGFRSRLEARFSRMLDSISNLAVSALQHEIYAVALQGAPFSLQLVFAGNTAVPRKTTEHIDNLWQYLQKLTENYARFHKLSNFAESLSQAKKDKWPFFTRVRIIQFEREALEFYDKKLNSQFSKHLASFKQIDYSGLPPESRFLDIYSALIALTKVLEKRADFKEDQ